MTHGKCALTYNIKIQQYKAQHSFSFHNSDLQASFTMDESYLPPLISKELMKRRSECGEEYVSIVFHSRPNKVVKKSTLLSADIRSVGASYRISQHGGVTQSVRG